MREIEIQATISRSLYREMVYFQMFRRKRTTLPFGIVAYLLAAGTVIAKLTGYYTVDSYAFGMFTFYACVIYLFFPPVLIGLLEYQIHRMSTGNKTVVGQSHRIVFNENGVASYVGKAAGKFTWKQVLEAYELKNAFLFYISQSQALALAKKRCHSRGAAGHPGTGAGKAGQTVHYQGPLRSRRYANKASGSCRGLFCSGNIRRFIHKISAI